MAILSVNVLSCLLIFTWACFSILSKLVDDGIVGKVIYICMSMAALSVVLGNLTGHTTPNAPATAMHLCFAALGVRRMFIELVYNRYIKKQ